jgi:NAD(P)-dependent dehydrogenase (short-subunit alcohol dehydrogenase family)
VNSETIVVIGTGGMGLAIARRCGSGSTVLLADVDDRNLDAAASVLSAEGHDIRTHRTDVADAAAVSDLAAAAAALGPVRAVAHTAGLSPVQAAADKVIAVDLLGVAHMLDAFGPVIAPGGAGVVIASMAAHLLPPGPDDDEATLALVAVADLAAQPSVQQAAAGDPGLAYAFAKRTAVARVRAAAVPWGRRGARVNSISPGVIATGMGHAELEGPSGEVMRQMVASSGTGRLGTADDIAAAAEFLLSPRAAFITGTDLLVDGGVVAAFRSGQLR